MHQFSSDSAIDTTTDRPNHSPFWSTDLADAGDFLANELFLMTTPVSNTPRRSESLTTDHCPVCRTAADVKNKLADDFSSARRVGNFRMELDTVPWFVIVGDSREGGVGGMTNDMEVGRNFRELISMRHPDLQNFPGKFVWLQYYNLLTDLELVPKSFEEDVSTVSNLFNPDLGKSIFSARALGNLSFQVPRHLLHLIENP